MILLVLIGFAFIASCTDQVISGDTETWASVSQGWENSVAYRSGDDKAKEVEAFEDAYNETTTDTANDPGNKKVVICHIPPGNPANAHTIEVSENAVDAHMAHGDVLGPCPVDNGDYDPTWDPGDDTTTPPVEEPAPDEGSGDLGDVSNDGSGNPNSDCGTMEALPIEISVEYLNPNAGYKDWTNPQTGVKERYQNFYMGTNMQYRVKIKNLSNGRLHHIEIDATFEYNYRCECSKSGQTLAGLPLQIWNNVVIEPNQTLVLEDFYTLDNHNSPTFFQTKVIVRRYNGACVSGANVYNNPEAGVMYDPIPE